MLVRTLRLTSFRNYRQLDLELGPGLTAVVGENGQGKTNLLEAIGYVAGSGSIRGATDDALVMVGAESALIRCQLETEAGREAVVDCEISRTGRNRIKVNHQPLRRARDLLGVLAMTVFSPTDLELVKGAPGLRRTWLDGALVMGHRRHQALLQELERILKQRNALLKQSFGRATADVVTTLDVWDTKLAGVGDELRGERVALLDQLRPLLAEAYRSVADRPATIGATYSSSWSDESLATALVSVRPDDLRRGVTTVGPHRDDVVFTIDGIPARSHASQGEQRSLALSLRLAVDALMRQSGVASPVLLLDDVFSELDDSRSRALLDVLPDAQRFLTSATGLPATARPDRILCVAGGVVTEQP